MIRLALCVTTVAVLCVAASPARAEKPINCEILEVRASNEDGGLDPALKPLAKKFKKPPFNSWKTFKLLKKHATKVEHMKEVAVKLTPGGRVAVLYRQRTSEAGKNPRLHLEYTLDDKNGKRKVDAKVNLHPGDYTVYGGMSLPDGGTYILAITCRE